MNLSNDELSLSGILSIDTFHISLLLVNLKEFIEL
jgi:hypothetical protein